MLSLSPRCLASTASLSPATSRLSTTAPTKLLSLSASLSLLGRNLPGLDGIESLRRRRRRAATAELILETTDVGVELSALKVL